MAEDRPAESPHDGPRPETSTRRLRALTQLEFELEFLGSILERDPLYADALRAHGNNLAAKGLHARALPIDRRLVRLRPERPIPWYNLACTYAVLGMTDPALASLARALDLGYRHFKHLLRDPDLAALHADPRFHRLLKKVMSAE
jgi:tetratricopeptide (TPR) repeat protein